MRNESGKYSGNNNGHDSVLVNNSGMIAQETYHGRIDWDVAKRFLQVIYTEAPIKKTSLAMKAGVNYSTCCRYTMWLAEVNWIEVNNDGIRLAQPGRQVYGRILQQITI